MTAWKPKTSPVVTCQQTRDGRYLVITASGDSVISDHEVAKGKRLIVRGGKPQIPAADPNIKTPRVVSADEALKPLEAIRKIRSEP